MIHTETVPVIRLSPNTSVALETTPGPQLFPGDKLLLAVRLADREALSHVRSYGVAFIDKPGCYSFAEPVSHASAQELREFREAAEWLDWRALAVVRDGAVHLRKDLPQ